MKNLRLFFVLVFVLLLSTVSFAGNYVEGEVLVVLSQVRGHRDKLERRWNLQGVEQVAADVEPGDRFATHDENYSMKVARFANVDRRPTS